MYFLLALNRNYFILFIRINLIHNLPQMQMQIHFKIITQNIIEWEFLFIIHYFVILCLLSKIAQTILDFSLVRGYARIVRYECIH